MRRSIPGFPGLYYDSDVETTALSVVLTAAGRYAPKPNGYVIQALPYLWSFDVDLRDVPSDHPIQYLHPDGARDLRSITDRRETTVMAHEVDRLLRFVLSVNRALETSTRTALGVDAGAGDSTEDINADDTVVIEIEDGRVRANETDLQTDEFDPGQNP